MDLLYKQTDHTYVQNKKSLSCHKPFDSRVSPTRLACSSGDQAGLASARRLANCISLFNCLANFRYVPPESTQDQSSHAVQEICLITLPYGMCWSNDLTNQLYFFFFLFVVGLQAQLSTNMAPTLLSALTTATDAWTIKVKVLRLWDATNPFK